MQDRISRVGAISWWLQKYFDIDWYKIGTQRRAIIAEALRNVPKMPEEAADGKSEETQDDKTGS